MASKSRVRYRWGGSDGATVTKLPYTLVRSNGTVYKGNRTSYYTPFFYSMRDIVGSGYTYNPVTHTSYRYKPHGPQPTTFRFNSGNPLIVYDPYWFPPGTITSASFHNTLKPTTGYNRSDKTFAMFADEALLAAAEQIPDSFDGLNLIRDIATLKGLTRQIVGVVRRLWQLLTRSGRVRRLVSGLALKELLYQASNGFLLAEFGVKPLIREVSSMFDALDAVINRITFLARTVGAEFPCRYGQEFWVTKPDILGFTDTVSGHQLVTKFTGITTRIKFGSTIMVKNQLVGLDTFLGNLNAYLAVIGFGRIATFAWDLVPFSFVVDWFFQVNRFLDRHVQAKAFGGALRVVHAGTSHSAKTVCNVTVNCPELVDGSQVVGSVVLNDYSRQVGIPARLSSYLGSALTSKQWEILTALAFQRRLR